MNIPPSWLKNLIETYVLVNVKSVGAGTKYVFQLRRKYIKNICGFEIGARDEVLMEEELGAIGGARSNSWVIEQAGYKRMWNYKKEIDKALKGDTVDLRARALDALASNSSFEKDKFISDWLEQYGK